MGYGTSRRTAENPHRQSRLQRQRHGFLPRHPGKCCYPHAEPSRRNEQRPLPHHEWPESTDQTVRTGDSNLAVRREVAHCRRW